jgi:hypothetical protein
MIDREANIEQGVTNLLGDVGFLRQMLIVSVSLLVSMPLSSFVKKQTGSYAGAFATLFGGTYLMSKGAAMLLKDPARHKSKDDHSR